MSVKNVLYIICVCLFCKPIFAAQNISKDTTYTVNSAYNKYKLAFPQIEIVNPKQFKNVILIENISYKTTVNRNLNLDAFINKNKSNPAVVLIHGGGWKSGDKSHMRPLAQYIASKGYSCFSVEYRLSDEAKYPYGIYDIKEAIKYIKLNAVKFNLDTTKVAVLGASSGAQMASLVGVTNHNKKFENDSIANVSSSVQAIVNLDGILAFKHPKSMEGKMASLWLGGTYKEVPETWKEASALSHVNENTPPILFIGSQFERFQAGRENMIAILNNHKIYNQVEIIQKSPHTFWLFHPWFTKTTTLITTFLDITFKKK